MRESTVAFNCQKSGVYEVDLGFLLLAPSTGHQLPP